MDLSAILINSFWSGLVAGGVSVLFTAPPQFVPLALIGGFAGRCARDICLSWGLTQNVSVFIGALVVVLIAVAVARRHVVSPVVLIAGVIPLGAAVAMFNVIIGLMKISSLSGEAQTVASVALSANVGTVVTTTLAIAVGLGIGMAIVRSFQRETDQPQVGA